MTVTSTHSADKTQAEINGLGRPKLFVASSADELQHSANLWLNAHSDSIVTQLDLSITGDAGRTTIGFVAEIWSSKKSSVSNKRELVLFTDIPSSSLSHHYPRLQTQLDSYFEANPDTLVTHSSVVSTGEHGKVNFMIAQAMLVEHPSNPEK